ncbi:MAG: DUF4465 domain-containing protein [Candidatus Cryptobacteroides sp.]
MKFVGYFTAAIASAVMLVSCFGDQTTEQQYTVVATFDYSDVQFNADSLFFASAEIGGFGWQDLAFWHKLDTDETTCEGGFVLTNMLGRVQTTEELPANVYRAYCSDAKKGNVYSVFRYSPSAAQMPEHAISFISKQYGTCTVSGCYVTNSEYVAQQVKNCFQMGDRLRLKAKGYLDNTLTGEAEMSLAEFSADKDSIVSIWTPFDLSKLGSVDCIDFEVTSTKDEVLPYFCMDIFIASVHLKY